MFDNEDYRGFVQSRRDLPIFFQDWWMDAVCGEGNWRGFVVKSGDVVRAICPLKVQNRKFGRIHYIMPNFTPYNGVYYNYPLKQKYCTKLAFEKDMVNELLSQIGPIDYYYQKFEPGFTNWLPYYWNDFKQTTTYTYRICDLRDMTAIYNDFQQNIRGDIRKAEKKCVSVVESDDLDLFYNIANKTFERQSKAMNYTLNDLRRIDDACKARGCRKILMAKDGNGNIHCVAYLVWDAQTMYYLIGGGDPVLRNSGATSLLIYESIKFASTKVNCFDFEGSVIEPIERFFRGFGAKQYPIMCISKRSNKEVRIQRLIDILQKVKIW